MRHSARRGRAGCGHGAMRKAMFGIVDESQRGPGPQPLYARNALVPHTRTGP
jgi:hypothetical protein